MLVVTAVVFASGWRLPIYDVQHARAEARSHELQALLYAPSEGGATEGRGDTGASDGGRVPHGCRREFSRRQGSSARTQLYS